MALRLGLVGRGRWGRNIERTLLSFSDVSVIAVGKGEKFPRGLDGVLIATPSSTHAAVALTYIDAGIATFIEKPMTTSVEDAERLREAAMRSGAVVFVGHIFLYNPAFLAALELLPRLGTIQFLLCESVNDQARTDCSVLWDWLPHDLSMARAIFSGDPGSVTAWSLSGGSRPQAALVKFQFGTTPVVSTVSWLSPVSRKQTTIVGTEATLVFDDKAAQRLTLHRKHGDISYPAYLDELPLTREMRAFMQCARSGKPDANHIEMGSAVVRAIVAAEVSIGLGGQSVAVQ
jgi:predicted dehydrogenase